MREAFDRSQSMLENVLALVEEQRTRDILRLTYGSRPIPPGHAARIAAEKASKEAELAAQFPELPTPLDEVRPMVDAFASITPQAPTYTQSILTQLPHYAMLISTTVFDSHVTPQELLGQPDTSSGSSRAAAPGIESLYQRQDTARVAMVEARQGMAHLFSFVYEAAFALYDMGAFYYALDKYDTAYRGRLLEALDLKSDGRPPKKVLAGELPARARSELVAEVVGASDPTLTEARHALLLKIASKKLIRATLMFDEEDAEGRPTDRQPMDPLLHEQATKNLELFTAQVLLLPEG